jgi:hypothetical protein
VTQGKSSFLQQTESDSGNPLDKTSHGSVMRTLVKC